MSLILTGNPGVGKHTVAKKLAKKLNLDLIDINKIAIQEGIFEENKRILDVDVIKLKKILKKIITKKSLVVGHLAPYVVSRKQVKIAVVLRRNPYELISVYGKRKYSYQKEIENLGSEILGVIYYDSKNEFGSARTFQINTSGKSVRKLVKKISDLFVKGVFREEKVDWLGLISEKNDLKRFFFY
ncbi:MAG TPA: AAA family ATPase [Nitrosopumilaceae archaeon]|nr:AAA family ATPase [Nitrosopumilaceae archaeon]